MMKYVGFFVIFLTYALGGFLHLERAIRSDDLRLLANFGAYPKNPKQLDAVTAGSSRVMVGSDLDGEDVYECKPGEKLVISDDDECSGKHFKGCEIWLKSESVDKTCLSAIFEECYVAILGSTSATNTTFIRSVVEVYDSPYYKYSNQTVDCTALDSVVYCYPVVYKHVQDGPMTRLYQSFSCLGMHMVNSVYSLPDGGLYDEFHGFGEYTRDYPVCDGLSYDTGETDCRGGMVYYFRSRSPFYYVYHSEGATFSSCCISHDESSRTCVPFAEYAPQCDVNLSTCYTKPVGEGGLEIIELPGIPVKLNALLCCISLTNWDDSECYLEACRDERGCGEEWNFTALVNDTLPSAPLLKDVREAWKSIVNSFSVATGYLSYCIEITATCKKFGDASDECYESRASAYGPHSAMDPRLLDTGNKLDVLLKAHQKSNMVKWINEEGTSLNTYPKMRYEWKDITVEMLKAFMQAQRMLNSLSDETALEGQTLVSDLDASLQALVMVAEDEEEVYTSYRGILLQLLAVVRGYSCGTVSLPSSGLNLPIYSASFLVSKLERYKDRLTYESIEGGLNFVITEVKNSTMINLAQMAADLIAQDSVLQVELELALNEMERLETQVRLAMQRSEAHGKKMKPNFEKVIEAVENYEEAARKQFYTELAFSFLFLASFDFTKVLKMKEIVNIATLTVKILTMITECMSTVSKIMNERPTNPDDKGMPFLPNLDTSGSASSYVDGNHTAMYMEMAKKVNEALAFMGPGRFQQLTNDFVKEISYFLHFDDGAVKAEATNLLMDVKTGNAYKKDAYDAMVNYASVVGRAASISAQITGVKELLYNIKNLEAEAEAGLEETQMRGSVAALQMMLQSLKAADLVAQLCNCQMYANGGEIDPKVLHICGVEGGSAPTAKFVDDVIDGKATLGNIVSNVRDQLSTFQEAPELFHRYFPVGLQTRVGIFTFKNTPGDESQWTSDNGLGNFLSGEPLTFSFYKGSPLLSSFTTSNFNNPMLVGFAALIDGVKINNPDRNLYLDINMKFSNSFEIYNSNLQTGKKTFLKPELQTWPVNSVRPMYDEYCYTPIVLSPETGAKFCFQTSLHNLELPRGGVDDYFSFNSIYTSYTLTLENPELLESLSQEELSNVSLSLFMFYYNTKGEEHINSGDIEVSTLKRIDTSRDTDPVSKDHSISGYPAYFRSVPEGGNQTVMHPEELL